MKYCQPINLESIFKKKNPHQVCYFLYIKIHLTSLIVHAKFTKQKQHYIQNFKK